MQNSKASIQKTNLLALIRLLRNMLKFSESASDMVVVSEVNLDVMSPAFKINI